MTDGALLEIELTVVEHRVRAELANRSDAPVTILHTTQHQACQLLLVDASGRRVEPFDDRAIKKGDNTVYCTDLAEVPAHESRLLFEGTFEKATDGYDFRWGPYEFKSVPAGRYHLSIRWVATVETCFDEDSLETDQPETLWVGALESETREIPLE